MLRNIFMKPNTGRCGCSHFKPSDIIEPKPKSLLSSSSSSLDHHHHHQNLIVPSSSSSSSKEKESSTMSFSHNNTASSSTCSDHDFVSLKLRDSVAVLKESKDPFLDFRHSMLEMISEKEIYWKDELQELLELFLRLNSVCHHQAILKAFMDIWDSIFSSEACESIELGQRGMHGGH